MLRRGLILFFAFLLAACPMLGLASEPVVSCAHCPGTSAMKQMPCHQQTATSDGGADCHHCAGCSACAISPYLDQGTPAFTQVQANALHHGYRPAHFYRLTSPPLDRPPATLPA